MNVRNFLRLVRKSWTIIGFCLATAPAMGHGFGGMGGGHGFGGGFGGGHGFSAASRAFSIGSMTRGRNSGVGRSALGSHGGNNYRQQLGGGSKFLNKYGQSQVKASQSGKTNQVFSKNLGSAIVAKPMLPTSKTGLGAKGSPVISKLPGSMVVSHPIQSIPTHTLPAKSPNWGSPSKSHHSGGCWPHYYPWFALGGLGGSPFLGAGCGVGGGYYGGYYGQSTASTYPAPADLAPAAAMADAATPNGPAPDLALLAVNAIDGGDAGQQLGPAYRMQVTNAGQTDCKSAFSVQLALGTGSEPAADAPSAAVEIPSLAVGETRTVDVRLPAEAASNDQAGTQPPATLFVAVDPQQQVADANRENNAATLDRTKVTLVPPSVVKAESAVGTDSTLVTLAGEGFGTQPGSVRVEVGGLRFQGQLAGWSTAGAQLTLPQINTTEPMTAKLTLVRSDGVTADTVNVDMPTATAASLTAN